MKIILIAAMLMAAPAYAADPNDAIQALFTQIDGCIGKKDAQCLGDLLADDATLLSPTLKGSGDAPKIIKGKAEIIKTLSPLMKETPPKQKTSVRNVRVVDPSHAFVDCAVEFSDKKASEAMSGYYCAALVVLKNGKWLVQDTRSIAVVVLSPPAAPPSSPAQSGTPAQPAAPADAAPKS